MGFSFSFLRAKDLHTSLLIMRSHIFYSPVRRGSIRKVSVHLVQKYFPHDCNTDSISCSEQGGKESDEKYQNKTATRQRRDSATVSNLKAKKINTSLSLSIHQARRQSAAASVVFFDPLDALYILRRSILCCCCSLCGHLLPLTPTYML